MLLVEDSKGSIIFTQYITDFVSPFFNSGSVWGGGILPSRFVNWESLYHRCEVCCI